MTNDIPIKKLDGLFFCHISKDIFYGVMSY